jgi:hypothetical protein
MKINIMANTEDYNEQCFYQKLTITEYHAQIT